MVLMAEYVKWDRIPTSGVPHNVKIIHVSDSGRATFINERFMLEQSSISNFKNVRVYDDSL